MRNLRVFSDTLIGRVNRFRIGLPARDCVHPWVARLLYAVVLALVILYAFSERRKSLTATTALEEASLRFNVFLIAEGIQAYRDSTGTIPATLEEAGLDEEGIAYITDGATYRLVARDASRSIVYAEGDQLDRHGMAFHVIEGGAVR